MHDPDDTFLPDYDGLSGLASREAQSAIPSHYALSLAELRQPAPATQRQAEPATIIKVLTDPHDEVESFKALVPRIVATLRRIAASGESADHAQLEALAGRLSNLDYIVDEIVAEVSNLRRRGDSWRVITNHLNELAAEDERYKPPRGGSWSPAKVRLYVSKRDASAGDKATVFELSAHIIERIEEERAIGATWEEIATKVNTLAADDERYKPPQSDLWTRVKICNFYKRTIAQR